MLPSLSLATSACGFLCVPFTSSCGLRIGVLIVTAASIMQHATEGDEPFIRGIGSPTLWLSIDRAAAGSLFFAGMPIIFVPSPRQTHILTAFCALICLCICDLNLVSHNSTYDLVHSLWHVLIFLFIVMRFRASECARDQFYTARKRCV